MKHLNQYIQEKYLIDDHDYTDEELRRDYDEVSGAYTKAEKKAIADKYGFKDLRIRPIQIGLLDLLRENRQKKDKFDEFDRTNFIRYEVPEKYEQLKKFLDEEPRAFIEYLLSYYQEKMKKEKIASWMWQFRNKLSIHQRYLLKREQQFKQYLEETKHK